MASIQKIENKSGRVVWRVQIELRGRRAYKTFPVKNLAVAWATIPKPREPFPSYERTENPRAGQRGMGLDPEFLLISELERQYSHLLAERSWLGIDVRMDWVPIVRQLLATMDSELTQFEKRRVKLSQVKQKWGELRVYYDIDDHLARLHVDVRDTGTSGNHFHIVMHKKDDPLTDKIDGFIERAAVIASQTCEACAAPGRCVNSNAWFMVACHAHAGDAK